MDIKFRVCDKKDKKFSYYIMKTDDKTNKDQYYLIKDNNQIEEIDKSVIDNYANNKDRYEIQFKSDVDNIYDGDIVQVTDEELGEFIGKVIYFPLDGYFEIAVYKWLNKKDKFDYCFVELSKELDSIKVIGNTCNSPELLEELEKELYNG